MGSSNKDGTKEGSKEVRAQEEDGRQEGPCQEEDHRQEGPCQEEDRQEVSCQEEDHQGVSALRFVLRHSSFRLHRRGVGQRVSDETVTDERKKRERRRNAL